MANYNYTTSLAAGERDEYAVSVERSAFIVRTYGHLMGAIIAFILIEVVLFQTGIAQSFAYMVQSWGQLGWLGVLGGFMVVGILATKLVGSAESRGMQYVALGAYIAAEALIFAPLLVIASVVAPDVIGSAALVTLLAFAGLTAIAFVTRKDFSFLRGLIMFAGVLALALIVAGAIFGFVLGLWFAIAMVGLAGAAILYETSNMIHHYPTNRHVAAALGLFASVALMFWYILIIFMDRR